MNKVDTIYVALHAVQAYSEWWGEHLPAVTTLVAVLASPWIGYIIARRMIRLQRRSDTIQKMTEDLRQFLADYQADIQRIISMGTVVTIEKWNLLNTRSKLRLMLDYRKPIQRQLAEVINALEVEIVEKNFKDMETINRLLMELTTKGLDVIQSDFGMK